MLDAIALKESASPASSRAPPAGARAVRSPAASRADAALTRSIDCDVQRASRSPAPTAAVAEQAATARIFVSAPMWNIAHPEANTATSGTQTDTSARPASWSHTVGAARRR